MKRLISRTAPQALLCAALLLGGPAAFAHGAAHGHEAQHGGVVVEASDVDFELVASAQHITLYVRDHGKAANTEGASAKLTLLSGGQKTEVALAPAGENRLQAQGDFTLGAGTKALAQVTLAGKKPIQARFVLN